MFLRTLFVFLRQQGVNQMLSISTESSSWKPFFSPKDLNLSFHCIKKISPSIVGWKRREEVLEFLLFTNSKPYCVLFLSLQICFSSLLSKFLQPMFFGRHFLKKKSFVRITISVSFRPTISQGNSSYCLNPRINVSSCKFLHSSLSCFSSVRFCSTAEKTCFYCLTMWTPYSNLYLAYTIFSHYVYVAARLRSLRTDDPSSKGHPRSIRQEFETWKHFKLIHELLDSSFIILNTQCIMQSLIHI